MGFGFLENPWGEVYGWGETYVDGLKDTAATEFEQASFV
jgi:hypothetical protein